MLFTDIRLQNYRSYIDSSFELGSGVNIVVGPNAIGKTNLLEALIYSSGASTYRGKDDAVVRRGQSWARIDTHTNTNQLRTIKIARDGEKTTKSIELDGKKYTRLPHSQTHPVVLFEPNHLFLLSADPSLRREYIDDIIGTYDPTYSDVVRRYKRALAQRNRLLKSGLYQHDQLFVWSVKLAELAEKIVYARLRIIQYINEQLSEIYSSIATKKSTIYTHYLSKIDTKNYSTKLLKYLEHTLPIDIERGYTGAGPHREDIMFELNKHTASNHASRGEIRTLLLGLKIFELELIGEKRGIKPLLLLDDVFSELDGSRRKALTSYLKNHQTLITTTDADVVIKSFTEESTIIPLGDL